MSPSTLEAQKKCRGRDLSGSALSLACLAFRLRSGLSGLGVYLITALTYQNLQKSRVPINSILGFIIGTYKKVGFGRLR